MLLHYFRSELIKCINCFVIIYFRFVEIQYYCNSEIWIPQNKENVIQILFHPKTRLVHKYMRSFVTVITAITLLN